MTRDRLDDAVRGLARATDEQLAAAAGPEGREALLEGIVRMPPTTTPRRSRLRLAAGIAVGTLAVTGAGWGYVLSSARDTTTLLCQLPDSPSIIDAVSGDPVTDCAAEWERQLGRPAPALVAYDNGRGGVTVLPADAPPPDGGTPLPPGAGQNLALIELQESLADHVAGLPSRCFPADEAAAFTQRELTRLGFADWSVQPRLDERARCFDGAAVDAARRRVVVVGGPGDPSEPDTKYNRLAVRLRAIAATCRTLPRAAAAVEDAIRDLGLSRDPSFREVDVTSVPAPSRCTTIRQSVGGMIKVTLRGPAR